MSENKVKVSIDITMQQFSELQSIFSEVNADEGICKTPEEMKGLITSAIIDMSEITGVDFYLKSEKKEIVDKQDRCVEGEKHTVWFNFVDHMKEWYYSNETRISGGKITFDRAFDASKMVGCEAIERVEKYAKEHPEIELVYCDDWIFNTSIIVLIPHRSRGEGYWGTTVIYIPQTNGFDNMNNHLNQFFLYPGHLENLKKALKTLRR